MNSLAKVIMMGTLADDPVVRTMESGRTLVGLSVFTLRTRPDTEDHDRLWEKGWHRIVIINQRLAAFAEAELTNDDQIYLEGELHTSFWRSETFEPQSLTEILLEHHGDKLMRLADAPSDDEAALMLNRPVAAGWAHTDEVRLRQAWLSSVA